MTDITRQDLEPEIVCSEATVGEYWALLKPRVMSLVLFTAFVGMMMAPGHLNPILAFVAMLCIGVGAGAAGAINMWYERDIDAIMRRTSNRPLPAGRMNPDEALTFGTLLAIGSVLLMGLAVNILSGVLLAFSIAFYVFVYTMGLKRRTPQNIVIGGAAGAFPPIIGWSAVTGDISLPPLILFGLVFLWTPPHFWALSLYRAGEYALAGVPMLPVVAGPNETRRQIVIYTLLLWPVALAPYFLDFAGPVYLAVAVAGTFAFTWLAVKLWLVPSDKSAKRLFLFSLGYLAALFATLLGERLAALALGWLAS